MRWFSKASLRFRSLFRKSRVEQELNDELRFHLDQLIEENIGRGMSLEEAHNAAMRELGGVDQYKEECRDARRIGFIEILLQDVRYGLRVLAQNPGFTIVTVFTLSIGICATSTIFSVANGLFLRPIPAKDPDQLVWISSSHDGANDKAGTLSYLDYLDISRKNAAFSSIAASLRWNVRIDTAGQVKFVAGELVSDNYFSTLGIPAALGRTFAPGGDWAQNPVPPVILSYGLWQRRFGADPNIIGKEILIDNRMALVWGVAPQWYTRFRQGRTTELWLPISVWRSSKILRDRSKSYHFDLLGRLSQGVVIDHAKGELDAVAGQLSGAFPETHKNLHFYLETEAAFRAKLFIYSFSTIMFGVGLVLAICCANISGMMLARAEARQHEIAIRLAMGAGRRRLLMQLLTESLMLATLGGGLGLLFTAWLLRLQSFLLPSGVFEMRFDVAMDARAVAFSVGITAFSAMITGLAPALAATKPDLVAVLKKEQSNAKIGRLWLGSRNTLLAGQMALSLILVAGAGLFLKTLISKETADLGIDKSKNVLCVNVELARNTESPYQGFFRPAIDRIQSMPGVKRASCGQGILEGGSAGKIEVEIPGKEPPLGKRGFDVGFKPVERNFFQTVGKRILRGRLFENQNDIGRRGVLINNAMARKFWPHEDPIGNQIQLKGKGYQIIGIVQDGRDATDLRKPPEPFFYLPFSELPFNGGTIFVETVDDPALSADAIRREVLSIDSNAKIISVETLKDDIGRLFWVNRLMFLFVGALGFIGIFLTAVGLYGVISYVMQRRTKEIGIRLALGAGRKDVVWLGLRHGLRVASIGAFFGLCAAVVATIIIAHMNDEIHSSPIVFIGACAFVLCVALLASYVPSRRAARVNPMVSLRCE